MNKALTHIIKPFGLRMLRKIANTNPLIINYHVVSNYDLDYIKHLYPYKNVCDFSKDMAFLKRNYHIIELPELLHSINTLDSLPRNAAMITFDDGFKEIHDIVAPILTDNKISAIFFLVTEFLDNKTINHDNKQSLLIEKLKQLDDGKICKEIEADLHHEDIAGANLFERILNIPYKRKELLNEIIARSDINLVELFRDLKPYVSTKQVYNLINNGFYIGSHGIDHARYSELSVDEQLNQTIDSIAILSNKFDVDYRLFAFPYTDVNISNDFFQKVSAHVDATFGTQDMRTDSIPNNFQRINGEKHQLSAARLLKYHYAKTIIFKAINKDLIIRD